MVNPPLDGQAAAQSTPFTAVNASFPSLRLGVDVFLPSQRVRLLGLQVISADLGLEKHALNVGTTCFHHLRQLRHIRRSLSTESATTLVHAFVSSWVDYCNVVCDGGSEVYYQQTATSVECGSASGQWHEEDRPWCDTATTRRSSLA